MLTEDTEWVGRGDGRRGDDEVRGHGGDVDRGHRALTDKGIQHSPAQLSSCGVAAAGGLGRAGPELFRGIDSVSQTRIGSGA